MMDYTYIIYTSFLLLFCVQGKALKLYYTKERAVSLSIATFCFLIICILQGCRYQVGTDWISYYNFYERIKNSSYIIGLSDYSSYYIEPIYAMVNILCAKVNLSYQAFFGIIAGGQIALYSLSFRNIPKYLFWGMLFYCLSFLISTQNIIRQTISTSVFVLSAMCLANDKNAKYLMGSSIAALIHYSSFITIPLIVLKNKIFRFLDNKIVGVVLFCGSYAAGHFLITLVTQIVPAITQNEKYISNLESLDVLVNYNSGLGLIFQSFTSILIIIYANKIINLVKLPSFYIIYRLFLVGTILQNAFSNSMFLQRVPFALTSLKLILISILVYLLIKGGIFEKMLGFSIVLISVLGFYMTIMAGGAGCSPYILKF